MTRSFPPQLVDEVVAGEGRTEERKRLLPARLVVYYVMGLALFASDGYEEVMRQLVVGLALIIHGGCRFGSGSGFGDLRLRF